MNRENKKKSYEKRHIDDVTAGNDIAHNTIEA